MLPWIIAAFLVIADQLSKAAVTAHLAPGAVHPVIPRVLDFAYVENTRGAYGLFGDRPWFLIMISLVAFAVIWLAFRERARTSAVIATALGLVLGGAVGNVADRLHYGYVVDFIRVQPLPFFEVFNLADMGISIGIAVIIVLSLRGERNNGSAA